MDRSHPFYILIMVERHCALYHDRTHEYQYSIVIDSSYCVKCDRDQSVVEYDN